MRETTAEETARPAVSHASHGRAGRGAGSPPVVDEPGNSAFVGWVKTWWSARISPRFAFRVLMAGSSISIFGSRISTVAFPMLVLHLYNSPFYTGLVTFAAIVPSMLAYVPAGVLVDRCNPRHAMLISELARGLIIASVVFSLIHFRHINILFLISAMVIEEILEIFSTLADRRYLSRLMDRNNLASQQAYVEVRTHAAVLAGRPIGPFLFSIQPVYPFLADALSFIASVLSLVFISRSKDGEPEAQRLRSRKIAEDIGRGLSWLRQDRKALVTIILMAATSLVAQALILMILTQAHSRNLSTIAVGVILAASGGGGAAGSICYKFLAKAVPDAIRNYWLPIQMALWGITLAFLWKAGGLPAAWSTVAMFVLGFTGAVGNVEFGTYLVATAADDMIAKITAIGQSLAIGACALGPVLGGYAIQRCGVKGAVVILCLIVLLLFGISLFIPEVSGKLKLAFRAFLMLIQEWTLIAWELTLIAWKRAWAACHAEGGDRADRFCGTLNSCDDRVTHAEGNRVPVLSGKGGSFT